jgi:GNAT superfamily N-acetyltransferase
LTNEKIKHAELVSMWVRPDARGAGVGARLIKAVVDWARGAGIGEVRLWVVDGNERAERVYLRLGFKRTGKVARVREGEPLMEFEMSSPAAPP